MSPSLEQEIIDFLKYYRTVLGNIEDILDGIGSETGKINKELKDINLNLESISNNV